MDNLVELQSQQDVAQSIVKKLSGLSPFILLCGEQGSGKTTICQLIADKVDERMQVIFLPCQSSLTLENLRELLLQQLLPEAPFDCTKPLSVSCADFYKDLNHSIIVADDIDEVPLDFLKEINELLSKAQGKLSFLGTCTKECAEAASQLFSFEKVDVMPLDYKESIFLCREYLASKNKIALFEGHWDKLPTLFKSKNYTPAMVFAAADEFDGKSVSSSGRERFNVDVKTPAVDTSKKSSNKLGYGLILLLLLGAGGYYLWSSNNDKDGKASQDDASAVTQEASQVVEDSGNLTAKVPEGIEVENQNQEPRNEIVISGEALDKIEDSASSGTVSSTTEWKDSESKTDTAVETVNKELQALGEKVTSDAADAKAAAASSTSDTAITECAENAPEAQVGPVDTENKNALRSDDNEGKAQDGVNVDTGSLPENVTPSTAAPITDEVSAQTTISSEALENSNTQESVATSKEEPVAAPTDDSADTAKTNESGEVSQNTALQETKPEEAEAWQESNTLTDSDSQENQSEDNTANKAVSYDASVVSLDSEKKIENKSDSVSSSVISHRVLNTSPVKVSYGKANTKRNTLKKTSVVKDKTLRLDQIPFSGQAIPGGVAEITQKDDNHYTIQVVSAFSKKRAIEVSAGVSGRYWIYETVRSNRPWYVLINGDYATAKEALDAIKRLPRILKKSGPFIKKFSQVKSEMDTKS